MTRSIKNQKDLLNKLYTEILEEDQLAKDYKAINHDLKNVKFKKDQLENELKKIKKELKQLRFNVFNLFKKDHGARKERKSKYQKEYLDLSNKLEYYSMQSETLYNQIEQSEAKFQHIKNVKEEYESLSNEIINQIESDTEDVNEVKKFHQMIKIHLTEYRESNLILEQGMILRNILIDTRRALSNSTMGEYDLYDIQLDSIVGKLNTSTDYSADISTIYDSARAFNKLIEPHKAYLRINISRGKNDLDYMFTPNAEYKALKDAQSNVKEWEETYNELEHIIDLFSKKRRELKVTLNNLYEKRHTLLLDSN